MSTSCGNAAHLLTRIHQHPRDHYRGRSCSVTSQSYIRCILFCFNLHPYADTHALVGICFIYEGTRRWLWGFVLSFFLSWDKTWREGFGSGRGRSVAKLLCAGFFVSFSLHPLPVYFITISTTHQPNCIAEFHSRSKKNRQLLGEGKGKGLAGLQKKKKERKKKKGAHSNHPSLQRTIFVFCFPFVALTDRI